MTSSTPSLANDRAEIADIVHRYAQYVRQGRGSSCSALFTEDATYTMLEADGIDPAQAPRQRALLEGKEKIEQFVMTSTSRGIRVVPMIHNLIVDVDGDSATATSVMETQTWPKGYEAVGEYEDSFRREGGRWLFSARKYVMYVDKAGDAA